MKSTILNFIYVKDNKEKLCKYFDSVELLYAGKKYDFNSSNRFEIDIELDQNYIYYKETLSFKTKENSEFSADYPIYVYKNNNIYVDIHKCITQNVEKIKTISAEIIYQSTMEKLLPNSILYDNKELLSFDSFENKYRKRIGLINIDPNKLILINEIFKIQKYQNFQFEDDESYEIIVRIPSYNEIQYSIAVFDNINMIRLKAKTQKSKNTFDKQLILKDILAFKNDFSSFLEKQDVNKIKTLIKDFNEKYRPLKIFSIDYYENIYNYSNFDEIDIDIFVQLFYYLEYLRVQMLKDLEEGNDNSLDLQGFFFRISKFNKKYEKLFVKLKN